jgi:PilZ domain-containing protein
MTNSLETAERQSRMEPDMFVIPVRYVAGGEVVQTTSTLLQSDAIHVRSMRPPPPGRVVGLQLWFSGLKQTIAPLCIVAQATYGANPGFWAEFAGNDGAKEQIAAIIARHRAAVDRISPRFQTQLEATLRQRGLPENDGQVTNLSSTGAFVRTASPPAKGAVVELDVAFPNDPIPDTVLAYVTHVAPGRGAGLQFIGADDHFRSRLDQQIARLAAGTMHLPA